MTVKPLYPHLNIWTNPAAALRLLIADAGLRRRLGEAAAEHARQRFDPAANARAVEGVYDSLLGLDRTVGVAARNGREAAAALA